MTNFFVLLILNKIYTYIYIYIIRTKLNTTEGGSLYLNRFNEILNTAKRRNLTDKPRNRNTYFAAS